MGDLEGFRRRLRTMMAERGLRFDADLARVTGMSPNTIGNIWKSRRKDLPMADQAVCIARALDTTVEYLVTGEHPPEQQLRSELASICHRLESLPRDQLIRIDGMIEGYLQNESEESARGHQVAGTEDDAGRTSSRARTAGAE